jgi:hypothetical protein
MIWRAYLLSVSVYSWYLLSVIKGDPTFVTRGVFPGLLVLALIPTFLGFVSSRHLLKFELTLMKLLSSHLLINTLYIGIIAAGNVWMGNLLPLPGGLKGPGPLLAVFWQSLAWALGAYYALEFSGISGLVSGSIKTMEIGLAIFIPAVFLLSFSEMPLLSLCLILLCWFVAFTLSLTLAEPAVPAPWGIIYINGLIPLTVAIVIFCLAFSQGVHQLFLSGKELLTSWWFILAEILDRFLGRPPEMDLSGQGHLFASAAPEQGGGIQELSLWWLMPFSIIGLCLMVLLVQELFRVLKFRLTHRNKAALGCRLDNSPRRAFMGVLKNLTGSFLLLFRKLKSGLSDWANRAKKLLYSLLPAGQTPYLKIRRHYWSFLRLGRKLGYKKNPWETPLEYARRFSQSSREHGAVEKEILLFSQLFSRAEYGNDPVSRQQGAEGERLWKRIKAGF